MLIIIRQAILSTLVLAVLLCGVYPLGVYLAGAAFIPYQAGGSLVKEGDTIVGSALVGQSFTSPEYFHGRPSAAGENGYAANSSSGSNLGPTSKALAERLVASAQSLRADAPATGTASSLAPTVLPIDMLTASGSGLDPHISPAGAYVQASRVAAARHIPVEEVQKLIKAAIEGPEWGLWGVERINVLRLNIALSKLNQR